MTMMMWATVKQHDDSVLVAVQMIDLNSKSDITKRVSGHTSTSTSQQQNEREEGAREPQGVPEAETT